MSQIKYQENEDKKSKIKIFCGQSFRIYSYLI